MRAHQRTRKLQSHQVVAFAMLRAQYLGAEVAGDGGQISQCGQRGAWDLKRNLRRRRDRAPNRDQHTAGGNIQGSGKLQEFLVIFSMGSNKYWDGQRQTRPPSTLCRWSLAVHTHAHPFPPGLIPTISSILGAKS